MVVVIRRRQEVENLGSAYGMLGHFTAIFVHLSEFVNITGGIHCRLGHFTAEIVHRFQIIWSFLNVHGGIRHLASLAATDLLALWLTVRIFIRNHVSFMLV